MGEVRRIELEASAASLGAVTEFVREGARSAGLPDTRAGELDLLVEELVMNVSRYAYSASTPGAMTITYWIPRQGELRVEVADQGHEFDPLANADPDLDRDLNGRPVGGLGIFLVKKFADDVTYRREQGWNRLSFGMLGERS